MLLPGMRLLAQMMTAEPASALTLVQMLIPSGSGDNADLLILSAAGLSLPRNAGLLDTEALQFYGKLPQSLCSIVKQATFRSHRYLCPSLLVLPRHNTSYA